MAAPREFFFMQGGQKVELPDPDPEMNADDVRKLYTGDYGFLTNATIHIHDHKPEEAQTIEFQGKSEAAAAVRPAQSVEFKRSAGTKG